MTCTRLASNFKLGKCTSVSSPSPMMGQERIHIQPYIRPRTCPAQLHIRSWYARAQLQVRSGHIRAQPHYGPGMHSLLAPYWVRDATTSTSTLGYGAFVLDHSWVQSQAEPTSIRKVCELNPTPLGWSARLKGNSTLSLSYSESALVIMILIIFY